MMYDNICEGYVVLHNFTIKMLQQFDIELFQKNWMTRH